MRKLLAVLLVLLLPTVAFALGGGDVRIILEQRSDQTVAAASAGPASPDLYIEFEQAWTPGSAYTPGGNDISPDTSIDTGVDFQRSGTYFASGSYSALNPVSDKGNFLVDITAKNIFDSATGFIELVVWANSTATNGLFEGRFDSSNYIYLYLSNTNIVTARRRSAAVNRDATSTSTCGDMTACMIQARWKQSMPVIEVRVCSDGTCDTESWEGTNTSSQDVFGTEPSRLYIGTANQSLNNDVYIDNFKLWNNYEQN